MNTTTISGKAALLASVPDVEKGKGQSKSPVVAIDDKLKAKVCEIAGIKNAIKDAEAHLELLQAEVIPQVEKIRRELSVRQQKHVTSIKLDGTNTLFITQHKYPAIPVAEEDRLRALFRDAYDDFFKTETKMEVDVSKLSEEALALLMRDGAVSKKATVKPTETFHAARSTDPTVAALSDEAGLKPVAFFKH